MNYDNLSNFYDAYYYAHYCGRSYTRDEEWTNFFGSIAEKIVTRIAPRTVLDAGCAMGFLVEGLRARGVEAFGIDISEYAIQSVHPSIRPYCWVGSICEPLPQRYDLIVSIEVLEHMSVIDGENAIQNLCQFTDDVLFASTQTDYKEATHVNVQPTDYWAQLFARQGFYRYVDFDASFITSWAIRFCRKSEPFPQIVRDYERRFWLLMMENNDLRSGRLEDRHLLARLESQITSAQQQPEISDQINSTQNIPLEDNQDHDTRLTTAEFKNKYQQLLKSEESLNEIINSHAWRWVQRFQTVRLFFIPRGSRRERLYQRILSWFSK
jgi:hypothetical protein